MEIRNAKLQISKAGGTAGKNSKTYKVAIPSSWASSLELSEDARDLEISFDGDQITIKKKLTPDEFIDKAIANKHDARIYRYMNGDTLCTTIYADFTSKEIKAINHVDMLVKTAFGSNSNPSWEDLMEFFEERCVARSRDNVRYYLDRLGLTEYDPVAIIAKTQGRMAEDDQWIYEEKVNA